MPGRAFRVRGVRGKYAPAQPGGRLRRANSALRAAGVLKLIRDAMDDVRLPAQRPLTAMNRRQFAELLQIRSGRRHVVSPVGLSRLKREESFPAADRDLRNQHGPGQPTNTQPAPSADGDLPTGVLRNLRLDVWESYAGFSSQA